MVAREEIVCGKESVWREWGKKECEGKKRLLSKNKQEGLKESGALSLFFPPCCC